MNKKDEFSVLLKKIIVGVMLVSMLLITYVVMGRQIPIHRSNMVVGSERIFYREISRFVHCDTAYDEVIVHEDETYTYVYELIRIGNGSCGSELYIWNDFRYHTLSNALDKGIISLEDFLESDVVVTRPISTET